MSKLNRRSSHKEPKAHPPIVIHDRDAFYRFIHEESERLKKTIIRNSRQCGKGHYVELGD